MEPHLEIRPASEQELGLVAELAGRIWRAHYPPIIGAAQTEYMLGWMYSLERLRADQAAGVTFELLFRDGTALGFCGYEVQGPELKLHKLYLDVSEHGQGLGSRMLAHVEAVARARACQALVLGVNKGNSKAIRAYERNGFRIREGVVTDIGSGYVMDDWIMAKPLEPQASR